MFLEEIVSEITVHLGFGVGPELLSIRPGPELLIGLPGPETLTVRPAVIEPLTDRPGGAVPLTGRRRSCGLLMGRPGPPELLTDFLEPTELVMGRPGPLELPAGRPGPGVALIVRLEGLKSLAGLLVPMIGRSGPELELPFWRLGMEPELVMGRPIPVLGRPGTKLELLLGCLTPGLLVLLGGVTMDTGREWLGWGGDFLVLCSVADF